jgi:hypothetical protein
LLIQHDDHILNRPRRGGVSGGSGAVVLELAIAARLIRSIATYHTVESP